VVGPRSGVKDISNRVVDAPLPGLISDLLGIEISEYDALGMDERVSLRFGESMPVLCSVLCGGTGWADVIEPRSAQVLARYSAEYYAEQPAVTLNPYGKGQAIYVGTIGDDAFCATLCRWLVEQAGIESLMNTPSGVEVVGRERNGTTLFYVLNHTDSEQLIEMPFACDNLLTGSEAAGWVSLKPYDVLMLQSK